MFCAEKILNNFILHIMNNFMTVMCKICFSSTHQILFRKLPIKYECFMIYFLFVLFSFLFSYQFHYWYATVTFFFFLLSTVSMLPSKHSLVQGQQKKTRKKFEICPKLKIKKPERHHWRQWHRSGTFNPENISHLFLVLLL